MPDLMDLLPVAPASPPARPEGAATDRPASPAVIPSFRFVPSPAPMLGHRWLDTFEIARLYAEAAQRSLMTTGDGTAARGITPGRETLRG